jgi:hypothetical protein
MNLTTLKQKLVHGFSRGLTYLLVGKAGTAKTAIIQQAWAEYAATDTKNIDPDVIVETPSTALPEDYKGLAAAGKDGKTASFLLFGFLEKLVNAKKETLLFLDDLGQASEPVAKALMHLIHARQIGEHRISDKVRIVCATNDRNDRAGVTGIISPLIGRVHAVIRVSPEVDEFIRYLLGKNGDVRVAAYLKMSPKSILGEPTREIEKYECPRSWDHVSQLLAAGEDDPEIIRASLGEKEGIQFIGFLKSYGAIGNLVPQIVAGEKVDVPVDPSACFALTGALTNALNEKSAANIAAFINRMSVEHASVFARTALAAGKLKKHFAHFSALVKRVGVANLE